MVRQLLGDQAVIDFARRVRDTRVAEASQQMMRNSATHRRGMAQRQMDAETGLLAAANNASVQGVRSWLMERLSHILTERKNRPMAEILMTPMRDMAQVASHIRRMRQQQERLRQIDNPQRQLVPAFPMGGLASISGLTPDRRGDERR